MNNVFTAKLLQTLNNKKGEKGFTLIELLVVVIIIGVLAAVALPNLLAQVGKARETEGKLGVGTITRSQQTRHFETGFFEDVTDVQLAAIGTNNLSMTVDSEYFDFTSDAGADGILAVPNITTGDGVSAAQVGITAAAVADATRTAQEVAEANGTRAFTSELAFASGNYNSILCQSNIVSATSPAFVDVDPTPATKTCGAGSTEIR